MRILVLHTSKGGSSKSTAAREIAVAASIAGVSTAMADLDPQGTTTGWYQRRSNPEPALVAGDDTVALERAGVALLVIDTPPGAPAFIPSLLSRADVVLVPVRPTPDDLLAAAPIARSLAQHPAWAFFLTQVPPRTRLLAGAIRQLASLGRVAPVQMTFRADCPAAIDGRAAVEFPGNKAADETAALWGCDLVAARPATAKTYARTLSLRLTEDQYRRLRRFTAAEEDKTGQRRTHQAVIETALSEYLDRSGG